MTVHELENILNTAIIVLNDNKKIATPEILSGLEKIVSQLQSPQQHIAMDVTLPQVLSGITEVINIEKRLVQTTMTDNLIRIFTNIQDHPIIMHLLARLL